MVDGLPVAVMRCEVIFIEWIEFLLFATEAFCLYEVGGYVADVGWVCVANIAVVGLGWNVGRCVVVLLRRRLLLDFVLCL